MRFLLATFLSALCCGSCAATSGSSAPPPALTTAGADGLTPISRLVDEQQSYEGRGVTVRGFVVPGPGGCLDMVCESESGCCGTCTADAMLAASPDVAPAEERLFLGRREGAGLEERFGTCRDSTRCELECTPRQGQCFELEGTFELPRGFPALIVEALRPCP